MQFRWISLPISAASRQVSGKHWSNWRAARHAWNAFRLLQPHQRPWNNQYDFVLDGIETGKEPDLVQTSFQTIKNRALLYFTVHYLPCAWSPCDVLGEIFFSQNKQLYDTSQGKVCLFTLFKNPDLRTHPISWLRLLAVADCRMNWCKVKIIFDVDIHLFCCYNGYNNTANCQNIPT